MTPDGQVVLRLRHRWSDGTTDILFEPTELLERLTVITPRPRVNLLLYYGVLAPRAGWRGICGRSNALTHRADTSDAVGGRVVYEALLVST